MRMKYITFNIHSQYTLHRVILVPGTGGVGGGGGCGGGCSFQFLQAKKLLEMLHSGISWTPKEWFGSYLIHCKETSSCWDRKE